jgi:hypothetical protein
MAAVDSDLGTAQETVERTRSSGNSRRTYIVFEVFDTGGRVSLEEVARIEKADKPSEACWKAVQNGEYPDLTQRAQTEEPPALVAFPIGGGGGRGGQDVTNPDTYPIEPEDRPRFRRKR